MNKLLTEEQLDLIDLVAEFGKKEVEPIAAECDRAGEFPWETYKKAFDMGLHMMDIPYELGGAGIDFETSLILTEELSKYDAGFATSVGAVGLAAKAVIMGKDPELIRKFADIVGEGKFAAFCLTEPNAGSDASATRTTAVLDGDEWVLNGRKCFITNGGVSGVYIVFATTDPSKGTHGISAFLVEGDREGLSVGKEEDKMGIRLSNTADVVLEDVRIPKKNLIGKEGAGFSIAMLTLDRARPVAGAAAVGIAQRAIDECVKYMKQRKTFGKPLAKHQALQFKIADMELQCEVARQYVRYVGKLVDNGEKYSEEAAISKTFASDAAMKITVEAVQILGGYGYSREYPVEKLMRDAKIFQIFEGTNEIQRMVIAGQVLK